MDSESLPKFKIQSEIKYNFVWTSVFSLMAISFLYKIGVKLINEPFDVPNGIVLIVFTLFGWLFLPMSFSFLIGRPAIAFTDKYLINNYNGVILEWDDISEMRMTNGMRTSGIVINLKQPEKYFSSSIKQIKYKIKQSYSANDMIIPTMFLSGDEDANFKRLYGYWTRHYDGE